MNFIKLVESANGTAVLEKYGFAPIMAHVRITDTSRELQPQRVVQVHGKDAKGELGN
jgi:hypothetical protein